MAALEFERIPYLSVIAMSPQGARDFFGGAFFKTVCRGQVAGPRWRFGAREYRLFRTEADWLQYQADRRKELSPPVKNVTPEPPPLAEEACRTAFEIGIAFAQALSDSMEVPMSPNNSYRVAVIRWSLDEHPYWADSGCGVLDLDKAEAVWRAGRAAGELCRIVLADSPVLKEVP